MLISLLSSLLVISVIKEDTNVTSRVDPPWMAPPTSNSPPPPWEPPSDPWHVPSNNLSDVNATGRLRALSANTCE